MWEEEAQGGGGQWEAATMSPEIIHRWKQLESRPRVAGDESVRDLGASLWRTLSAKLKSPS